MQTIQERTELMQNDCWEQNLRDFRSLYHTQMEKIETWGMVDVSAPVRLHPFFSLHSPTAAPRANAACEASHARWIDLGSAGRGIHMSMDWLRGQSYPVSLPAFTGKYMGVSEYPELIPLALNQSSGYESISLRCRFPWNADFMADILRLSYTAFWCFSFLGFVRSSNICWHLPLGCPIVVT